jgi:WD40 repeat protein
MLPSVGALDSVLGPPFRATSRLAYSQTGSVIATMEPGRLTTWDAASGRRLAEINIVRLGNEPLSLDGDGSRVAVSGAVGVGREIEAGVLVFDVRSGRQVSLLKNRYRGPALAYRPDSGRIAASGDDRESIALWDARSFKRNRTLRGHTGPVTALAYSPDGRMLASGDAGGTVRLWNDPSGSEMRILRGHTGEVRALAFSRHGAELASAASDGTARIWDPRSGRLIAVLRGHDSRILGSVSFSPDGSRVVTAAGDKTVRVWDPKTGDQLLVLRYRKATPSGATFTPDGEHVVSWSESAAIDLNAEPRLIWSTK